MQRVVRTSLVGLLTIAGLTACGDKVTVPQQTTSIPDNTVKQVTVSPDRATLNVGDKITLAASVNAGAGVTNRTVTWSSANSAIASVDANGVVTAVAAGNTSIIAKSVADPTVQAAAAITVQGGGAGNAPIVTVSTINQTVCGVGGCNSVPANLAAAAGQLDVTLNVEPNGATLKTITAILKCGTEQMVRTQTISAQAPSAEASAAPVTFSFNTAEFNGTTGIPTLHNGACTISASATTTTGTQSAVNTTPLTLANQDVVIVRTTTPKSASDANGLPWKGGDVTVAATPVLYSGRTPATVNITLPGLPAANVPTQSVAAATSGATSATWSATASTGPRTTQLTLIGGVDANGFAIGVHPTVLIIDSNGNDLLLPQANSLSESDARIDNQSPAAPTVFQIPTPVSATNATGMNGWVNAAYTFTGAAARYVSGGDAGVSNGAVSGTSGLNGNTTITYFAAPIATYTNVSGAGTPGTGTSATACATTGLTQITTAGDLGATLVNTAYRVRVNEADKLGNVRCTDLGAIAGAAAPVGSFGVDKVAPVDTFATASAKDQAINPGVPFQLAISDDASGFTATPALTTLTLLAPGVSGAATCVIGSFSSSTCNTTSTGSSVTVPGTEGYYTYTSTVRDQAQNAGTTQTRTALRDVTAPVMGGVSVPATITGGASASFSTSATDNIDLVSSNYTISYPTDVPNPPAGSTGLKFRTAGPTLGTAFDNVLTTTASFTVTAPTFLRNMQVTNASGTPVAGSVVPNQVDVRAVDAAGNSSTPGTAAIAAANVPQTSPAAISYASLPGFNAWIVSNAASNVCNSTTTCGATTSATTVTLTAQALGNLSTFQVPFNAVQFYYFNPSVNEWVAIGSPVVASTVTDDAGTSTRTFSWLTTFDPPASLGTGVNVSIIAVGYNTAGDALATRTNANITLTP